MTVFYSDSFGELSAVEISCCLKSQRLSGGRDVRDVPSLYDELWEDDLSGAVNPMTPMASQSSPGGDDWESWANLISPPPPYHPDDAATNTIAAAATTAGTATAAVTSIAADQWLTWEIPTAPYDPYATSTTAPTTASTPESTTSTATMTSSTTASTTASTTPTTLSTAYTT